MPAIKRKTAVEPNEGAFGETHRDLGLGKTSKPVMYGFAGRELDESGNYYNRARMYSPGTGRFLSQDPIGFGDGDNNYYRYVKGNPLGATDPSGTDPVFGTICFALLPYLQDTGGSLTVFTIQEHITTIENRLAVVDHDCGLTGEQKKQEKDQLQIQLNRWNAAKTILPALIR